MDEKRIQIMTTMSVPKAITKMALPMVAGMIVQVFYNLVDTFYIGQMNDAAALAAANLATPIFMITMAFANIIAVGAASLISRSLGRGDYELANKTLSISVVLSVGLSIVITVIGIVFLEPLLTILGADAEIAPYLRSYIAPIIYALLVANTGFTLGQTVRSEGGANQALISMLVGTGLNIILDPIFIFSLGLGIEGAAIATVIGQFGSLVYCVIIYAAGKTSVKISMKNMKFEKYIVKEILKIGIPMTFAQVLMSVSTTLNNNIAIQYGTDVVAGYGVAMKTIMLGTFVFMGFAGGCQPLIGYNYGARNLTRMKKIIKTGMIMTTISGLVLCGIFFLLSQNLVAIFSPIPGVIKAGTDIIVANCICFPFMGVGMLGSTTVQSMGKALPALFLSITRQGLLFIPCIFILNAIFGYSGFIYAQFITDVGSFILALIVLRLVLRREETAELMRLHDAEAQD